MERYGGLRPYTPPREPARHLARRVRRRVRRGRAVPAHPAPAHHRAPLPARRPARAARRTSRSHSDVWFATHAQIADVARAQLTVPEEHVMSDITTRARERRPRPGSPGSSARRSSPARSATPSSGWTGPCTAPSPRSSPSQFFAKGDPTAALLSTLAVFAVGFVMRPVGGALLGAYADRHGRKKGLTLTIGLMAGRGVRHRGLPDLRGDRRRRSAGPAAGPAGAGLLRGRRVRLVLLVPGRVGGAAAARLRRAPGSRSRSARARSSPR